MRLRDTLQRKQILWVLLQLVLIDRNAFLWSLGVTAICGSVVILPEISEIETGPAPTPNPTKLTPKTIAKPSATHLAHLLILLLSSSKVLTLPVCWPPCQRH